jgi:energy-coupling factor transport system ATP-binding protein
VGKDEVFEVLARLRQERSITILMVEHAAEQLAEMADRIIVLGAGEIIDQGPPDELYRNPRLFHAPDAERAPQIAELLYALEQDGLVDASMFTAHEQLGTERLQALLSRTRTGVQRV